MSDDIKVGDQVRASFSTKGEIVRFIQRRWGKVAVVRVNGGYPREIPVTNLTLITKA